jgi:predicted NAD/FAD-binding protein
MSAHLSEKFPRKKVAIIGSGCAGIGALWALNRTHHDVYIYEAADRLGGHTNTVNYTYNGHTTPVDTGFIVMNTATYRMFARLFPMPIVNAPDNNHLYSKLSQFS